MYDIIIIGGGPAGLTAAIYALRASKTVLVLEKETAGGQITLSPLVENIPGFESISGSDFADRLMNQAMAQGAEFDLGEAVSIVDHGSYKTVKTDMGEEHDAKAVIIATGITFCAVCDGAFYKGKTVALVGGGNSALVEAVMLSDLVKKLYILQDLPFLTGEQKMQEKLRAKDNVEILTEVRVKGFLGKHELDGIVIEQNGEERTMAVDGLFVAIGTVPQNGAFSELIDLDERGYVIASDNINTKTPGIFVAGDCRAKRVRQVTTAVSDGAEAGLAAASFIDNK